MVYIPYNKVYYMNTGKGRSIKMRVKDEFDDFLEEQLKDPEFKTEYDALEPEFAIVHAMIVARKKSGITQKELAEKTGMSQGDISKIERGNANPSLNTLKRLAAGMNMRLRLEFLPTDGQQAANV
jgi:DNA-binding XRE family transcriptional regulator